MNAADRGILVGMALGDAYINVRQRYNGNCRYVSSEMRILHSLTQIDYCEYKAEILRKILNRKFNVHIIKNGPGGKYKAAHFSASHPYFKQLKKWVYPGGKKTYSTRLLSMLSPEGIAYWYMDDGSARVNINKNGFISSVATDIATMCSKVEADIIVDWFDAEYGVKFNVRCRKASPPEKAFYIQANTGGSKEFAGIIEPYIIPSMRYKLRHVADLGSHERRAPVGKCSKCGETIYDNRRLGFCVKCYTRNHSNW